MMKTVKIGAKATTQVSSWTRRCVGVERECRRAADIVNLQTYNRRRGSAASSSSGSEASWVSAPETSYMGDDWMRQEAVPTTPPAGSRHLAPDQSLVGSLEPHSPTAIDEQDAGSLGTGPAYDGDTSPEPFGGVETGTADDTLSLAAAKILRCMDETQGCGHRRHSEWLASHNSELARHSHVGVHGILAVGMKLPSIMRNKTVLRDRHDVETSKQSADYMKTLFEGVGLHGPHHSPPHICLHVDADRSANRTCESQYDIDSFMGYPTSLGFCKRGFELNTIPPPSRNIDSNLHHTFGGDGDGRPSVTMRNTKHIYIGYPSNAPHIAVYCAFPHLGTGPGATNILKMEDIRRWYDRALWPALRSVIPEAGTQQYYPSGFDQSQLQALTRQMHSRVRSVNGAMPRQLSFPIQAQYLDLLWRKIQDIVDDPSNGLIDFHGVQLFFDCKGRKQMHRSGDIASCIHDFAAFLDDNLDMEAVDVDHLYVDLARDITPPLSESTTYLWRRCCIEHMLTRLFATPRDKDTSRRTDADKDVTYYYVGLLRDACNATCTPKKSDMLYKAGLRYSQFYTPLKNAFEAAKAWPFGSAVLEELALDPGFRSAVSHAGRSGGNRDIKVIQDGYILSKKKFRGDIQSCRDRAYGIRQEHRVAWPLAVRIAEVASERDGSLQNQSFPDRPRCVHPLNTHDIFSLIFTNATKFAYGFELTAARNKGYVDFDSTKVMLMFLQCLRQSLVGANLQRYTGLWVWKTNVARHGQIVPRYGLGFGDTIEKFGYAWMAPIVNWAKLTFASKYNEHVIFHSRTLLDAHRARRGAVMRVEEKWKHVAHYCNRWLSTYSGRTAQVKIWNYMIHVILREWRRELLLHMHAQYDHNPAAAASVENDDVPFCYEGFRRLFGQGELWLARGGRLVFKNLNELIDDHWGEVDAPQSKQKIKRLRWWNASFRGMYRVAKGLVYRSAEHLSDAERTRMVTVFERMFISTLLKFHWVIPVPERGSGQLTILSSASGYKDRRVLLSIVQGGRASDDPQDIRLAGDVVYRWGKDEWRPGYPDVLPYYARMGTNEFEDVLKANSLNGTEASR